MANNILVIGNGFDLAHCLKTRYDDFIEYVKKIKEDNSIVASDDDSNFIINCIKSNGFINYFLNYTNAVPGWVDLEHLIKEVIDCFEILFSCSDQFIDRRCSISWNSNNTDMSQRWVMRAINCLYMFPLFNQNNSRGDYYSMHLEQKYYTDEFGLNKREILRMLKKQLDDVIHLLQIYLNRHLKEKYHKLNKIKQIEKINPSYVISFNYTYTYQIYGISKEDVFYVHGNLDDNNMVLGFDDDEEENLDFIYFKKYFQRIQKLTGYIDENRFNKIDKGLFMDYPTVYFYGHSMDKTDGDIIQKLHAISSGFVIFKYNQEDYEQKVINLIDVFGKEKATNMIQTGFVKFVTCKS